MNAQELKCNITVNSSQVQNIVSRQVFETLKNSINELMNNTKWTNLTFTQSERIDCSIGIVFKTVTDNIFSCEMQIQSRRPIWSSSYSSTLLNLRDPAVNFTYYEFDPLQVSATYENNLVAVLAYYAYIIIGYNLDSFQKLGGTGCFTLAEQIVNLSQSRSEPEGAGWKAFDKNGKRYELVNNLLDERFKKFREYVYDYHRLGLDNMISNVANARAKIAEGLPILKEVNKLQPQSIAIISFIDAKVDELINIFSKHGSQKEKDDAYKILTDLNPSNTSRYDAIKK
jgi:hypothetical protein